MYRLLLAASLLATTVLADSDLQGSCAVTFNASATMHTFKGVVDSEPFAVKVAGAGDGRSLTWSTEVSPVKIDTKNKDRNTSVQETLKTSEYALLRGDARDVSITSLKGESADLPFALSIAGVNNSAKARISNLHESGEGLSFDAAFDVSMKDYALKPKSVIGLIRVHDVVHVLCHFAFTKPQS